MQPRFWLWRLPPSFRPPAVVWVLALLGFFLSVSASLTLPTYLGYDEPQHVDMVVAVAYGDGWPAPGDRHLALGIARGSNLYYGQQLKQRPLDEALTRVKPRGDRGSIGDLGGDASAGGLPNQIVQHPPLYYAGEALVVRLFGALDWPYDKLVGLLRILTALLVAPLPVLVWGIANRLRAGPQAAIAAAALSITVPGLSRVAGLVNNDGMLIITTTALLLGLTYVSTGDLTRRTGIIVGLLTGLALLSKGFALTFPLLVVLAYAIGARSAAVKLARAFVPLAWALGLGFLTGGLWWVRNILLYGALQPSGFGDQLSKITGPRRPAGSPVDTAGFWSVVHDRIARTFWAGVGIANQPTLTKSTGTWLFVLLAVLVVAGIAFGVRGTGNRGPLLLLLLPFPLVLVLVLRNSWSDFVHFKQATGLQGRYLYCAISGLAVASALALDRVFGRWRSALPVFAIGVAVVFQLTHATRLLERLWLAPHTGGFQDALDNLHVISPWTSAFSDTVFLLTVLTSIAVVVMAARGMFAKAPEPREDVRSSLG